MNNLININEFRKIISIYEPSISSKELLDKVNLTLLVAPSSTGRNTTINELVKKDQFQFIVTDTTRAPRIMTVFLKEMELSTFSNLKNNSLKV